MGVSGAGRWGGEMYGVACSSTPFAHLGEGEFVHVLPLLAELGEYAGIGLEGVQGGDCLGEGTGWRGCGGVG